MQPPLAADNKVESTLGKRSLTSSCGGKSADQPIRAGAEQPLHKGIQRLFLKWHILLAVRTVFGQKEECEMQYVTTSKICSMTKNSQMYIDSEEILSIRPLYLAYCFP